MEQGIIKRILAVRNYGFVSIDSGELFFHKSVVEGTAFEALQEGQTVEYESEDGPLGPKATVARAADRESQTVEHESEDAPEGSQDTKVRPVDAQFVVAVFTMSPRWRRKNLTLPPPVVPVEMRESPGSD